jgi:hypothetical protein
VDEQNEQNERPADQPQEPPAEPEPVGTPQPEPAQPQVEEPAPPAPAPVPMPAAPAPPCPVTPPGPCTPPRDTNTLIIVGWVLVAMSFLCCCCGSIFAIPGIILGIIAYSRGDQRGLWIIIAGSVALFYTGGAGIFLGANPHRFQPYFHHGWPIGKPV